jgi:hypothetical protein
MSDAGSADSWEVVVPADGDQLMAELRRQGVRPGQRVHLSVVAASDDDSGEQAVPAYFGSFRSGRPALAERASEILEADFPDR